MDYLVSHERLGPLAYRQFHDPAAARGVGLESQHGELAVGLALVVGSNNFDIFGHYVVCMNQQACRTLEKLLVSEEGAGSAQQFRLGTVCTFIVRFPSFEEGIDFLSQVMSVDQH